MPTDHLYLRGKIYHCWFYDSTGRVVRKSTGCTDRRAAAGVRQRLEREAQAGGVAPAEAVADALAYFLEADALQLSQGSQRAHGFRSLHLGRLLGHLPLSRLHRDDLTAYVKRRAAGELPDYPPAHPRTIKSELETLRRALGIAQKRGRIAYDPRTLMPALSVPRPSKCRWLTVAEYEKLRDALPPRWALWLTIAVYTGARREEIGALLWEDVDLAGGWVRIREHAARSLKTKAADRAIPLAKPLLKALRRAARSSGPVVGRWHRCSRTMHDLCAKLGLAPASPHDCRRTFASWMLQRGVSERVIADLLGHKGTQLVREVYGHLNEQALRAAVATLDGCEKGVKDGSGRGRSKPARGGTAPSSRAEAGRGRGPAATR